MWKKSALLKPGPRKRENIVAEMFPRLLALATFVAEIVFALKNKKCFWAFSKHFDAATNVSFARERGNIVEETLYSVAVVTLQS